jgi:hypothetical protein
MKMPGPLAGDGRAKEFQQMDANAGNVKTQVGCSAARTVTTTANARVRRGETTRFIQAARELLKPSPVRPGVPNWFRLRLLKRFGAQWGTNGFAVLMGARANDHWHWFDHYGRTEWHGHECFVSEPYDIGATDVQQISELAAVLDCEWHISSNSWHFPGSTLRVLLYPKAAKEGDTGE